MTDDRPAPRRSDIPTPGWYLLRLVRGGPWVAARITHDAAGWSVMVNGVTQGPAQDPWALRDMERVHWGGRPATEQECQRRLGLARCAALNDPDHHAANPRRAIDLDKVVPI